MRKINFKICLLVIGLMAPASIGGAEPDPELSDGRAVIFDYAGTVKILRSGENTWTDASPGFVLRQGDQLRTGKNAFAHISFDKFFLNILRVDENTLAEFRTIEPTDISMSDGTLFSALDGLSERNTYQISTPTSVAAVRGTHMDVGAEGGDFTHVAVVPDQKNEISRVDIEISGQDFSLQEGQQMIIPDSGDPVIQNEIDPAIMGRSSEFLSEAKQEQDAASGDSQQKNQDQEAENDSEDIKKGSDSNPPGGSVGGTQETSDANQPDAESDALIDATMDSDGAEGTDGFMGTNSEGKANTESEGDEKGEENSDGSSSKADKKVDAEKAVEFFVAGGMTGNGEADLLSPEDSKTMLMDLGMDADSADQLSRFMDKFSDIGGQFENMIDPISGLSEGNLGEALAMESFFEQSPEAKEALLDFFSDPGAIIDIQELIRDTQDPNLEQALVDLGDLGLAASNPYYYLVLEALEHDLTATEKAALITSGDGAELIRANSVDYDIDNDTYAEQIEGVRYYNDGGVVDAEYTHILQSSVEGSVTLQAAGSSPYLILSPDACNSSDPEGVC